MNFFKNLPSYLDKALLVVVLFGANLFAIAQGVTSTENSTTSSDGLTSTTTSTEQWYTNPLYLIIGAVLLIGLLALLLRGNRRD